MNERNNLIKGSESLTQNEISILREKFLNKYSKEKGWNPDNLTANQMLEIVSQKEYKTPNLLLS
jgi:hypothetical protein